jgi:hypothetical protein
MRKKLRTFRTLIPNGVILAFYLASFWLFMDLHLVTDNSAPWPEGDLHGPRTYWSLNDTSANRFLRILYDPLITWRFSYPEVWRRQTP